MIYLNDKDLLQSGIDWTRTIERIEAVVKCVHTGAYMQPLKPYLKFGSAPNRIIAMPAYVGGPFRLAGLKWIASFPGNIDIGLPRAHSITVLNDADSGRPYVLFHSALLSVVRTASVSGLMLERFIQRQPERTWKVGIIGFGPIGRYHAQMCAHVLGNRLDRISLYDVRGIDPTNVDRSSVTGANHQVEIEVRSSWRKVYETSDIFITCTAAPERYIDAEPASGRLLLHVSLRDYTDGVLSAVKTVVVDDWTEVCRENTDIERMHAAGTLMPSDCLTLSQVVCEHALDAIDPSQTVLFAPMGMAVFDIGIAGYFYERIRRKGGGIQLNRISE